MRCARASAPTSFNDFTQVVRIRTPGREYNIDPLKSERACREKQDAKFLFPQLRQATWMPPSRRDETVQLSQPVLAKRDRIFLMGASLRCSMCVARLRRKLSHIPLINSVRLGRRSCQPDRIYPVPSHHELRMSSSSSSRSIVSNSFGCGSSSYSRPTYSSNNWSAASSARIGLAFLE